MAEDKRLLFLQRLIAAPFFVLGAWCILDPVSVEKLSFRTPYQHLSTTSALLIGCFGAQAMLSGLFAVLSRFDRWTFLGYGLALLPFFAFNYYFVFVVPVFTAWMALDFVANLFMLVVCAIGWRSSDPSFDSSTAASSP
jgi:undecaprenyl pyrophosphate phosphatase UppP